MNLKEMLKKAIAEMTEVKKSVEKGAKSADDLQAAIAKVKELQDKVKAADEAEALMKGLNSDGGEQPADVEQKGATDSQNDRRQLRRGAEEEQRQKERPEVQILRSRI